MWLELFLAVCLSVPNSSESLPEVEFIEDGPQTYRFTCEYKQSDADDAFGGKQRIDATYTRGLPDGRVEWDGGSMARGAELEGEYPESGQALDYLSPFGYDARQSYAMFTPAFFEGFPTTLAATYSKNLVWDTHMLEQFGRSYFGELRLNEPYAVSGPSSPSVPLAGMGAFKNRRIELTWIGRSERHGEPCALIRYEAFFNTFDMRVAGTGIDGLSHYWGLIWVSLEDKQLEHGTLNEHVSLRVHRTGAAPTHAHVLRTGTLTHILSEK